jgi:hypothetical protein
MSDIRQVSGMGMASGQRSKVSRHTVTPVGDFTLSLARFLHIHIDLVGPLPTSAGYTYCLTAVDRFTRWLEAIPIADICRISHMWEVPTSGWLYFFLLLRILTDLRL